MEAQRRTGDAIAIPGDYQHRALVDGPGLQRAWHREKLALVDRLLPVEPGWRILDVGCGSGVLADRLAAAGALVLGVDANAAAVEYARRTFGRQGLSFAVGLLDELELADESFDAVTCLEVVEHVERFQARALLAELTRTLRPGGRLLLTTPNYRGLWPAVEWLADRCGPTARMDADQHVNRYHRRLLRGDLEGAGLVVSELCTYCTLAPFAGALSARAGRWLGQAERAVDLPFGNLLAALATRP